MPNILFCNVNECAYNGDEKCHAVAITVGGPQPLCDTFFRSGRKGGGEDAGSVGACKNEVCAYNESFECTAYGINVSLHSTKPECDTFMQRSNN
ncbi:MAG: DUF1540 domain-containing protein [Candidatus Omnitrophica bacterium]|nr:DUF1540 domain-containing protein [Candidatus Omnitrophota bacterium]